MFDAAAVIGRGRSDDYLLSPIEHADRLRASAPKLAALLTHSAPMELAQQYADADAEAVAAEATFKRWLTRANWTVLVTATVSAVLIHQRRADPQPLTSLRRRCRSQPTGFFRSRCPGFGAGTGSAAFGFVAVTETS